MAVGSTTRQRQTLSMPVGNLPIAAVNEANTLV